MTELWFKLSQWITTLNTKKLVIFLSVAITSLLLYNQQMLREENVNLRQENDGLHNNIADINRRNDSILGVANGKLQDCFTARFQDVETSNEYWKNKFDELEKRYNGEYRTFKKRKVR